VGNQTGNFANITLMGNGAGTVTVSITGNGGALGELGFNSSLSNPGSLTYTFVSGSGGSGNTADWSPLNVQTGKNLDGFGNYDVVVGPQPNGNATANNRLGTYTFTITGFTNPADALGANFAVGNVPGNHLFAAHYFPNDGSQTGFIDGATNSTPEPASMLLVGMGVAGMGAFGIYRRKKK
jgi:hypothetical protein